MIQPDPGDVLCGQSGCVEYIGHGFGQELVDLLAILLHPSGVREDRTQFFAGERGRGQVFIHKGRFDCRCSDIDSYTILCHINNSRTVKKNYRNYIKSQR